METIIVEMSEMSDSKELYHSKPPKACILFLYSMFAWCIFCIAWIFVGEINVVIRQEAQVVVERHQRSGVDEESAMDAYFLEIPVSSLDIQDVEVGMVVIYASNAFPQPQYGTVSGQVVEILPELYLDEKGLGYYIVKVKMNEMAFCGKSGREVMLQENMIGEAKILAGTKRIITYLQENIK